MIKKSLFIKSITDLKYRPYPLFPEFFLIGRSNAGKSSFVNALTCTKKLALFSKIPGKTITLNYFLLNDSFYLVDSPGYGFSKRSKILQKNIFFMMNNFLKQNFFIKTIFQIIDFQIGPTLLDLQIFRHLKKYNIPVIIILNKKDKISNNQIINFMTKIKKTYLQFNSGLVNMYSCSCKTKEGFSDIIYSINNCLNT
ncbi:ribosome biogenesis GTP-binding protein YihA/YsxC [Candidatus Phytoplasma melaleucae]|uniref:Probable GTP-binding protein EngB n=1 Tax=Candidatus Phytoplasma melaleucae TaxID=2982630 RepID=A0ABT9DDY4_9MOLU|nr:ribosome biogenesis GTP-binding protein YihA/YsxC ['Melaleuca sp.' phytoplasma]MDO8168230.1 ribosome biogenesis GTP-binding protein YihA/YsxC ['Melaleuca sp.' phytoplasma]MDV3205512.1 ribosome biogenesis GTP-binding protein YihA/YsxC [Weeping tea tree witches'-broom phytoplasma]